MFDYWQWSGSSLLDNTARGLVAEFLVATVLGLHKTPREEWGEYDMETASGTKIEVKSAGTEFPYQPKRPPPIQFTIAPRRRWDPERGYSDRASRWSDLYVFCLLKSAEPLDTEAWRFFVLRTDVLDQRVPRQKSIRLKPLLELGPSECCYRELKETIERVAEASTAE